jgi:hypothetical protein
MRMRGQATGCITIIGCRVHLQLLVQSGRRECRASTNFDLPKFSSFLELPKVPSCEQKYSYFALRWNNTSRLPDKY